MISLLLTVLGSLGFFAGSLADDAQGSVLGACLISTVPAGLLFLSSMSRVRVGGFLQTTLMSIVGALVMVVTAIATAISNAYANPSFEIARCTKAPTFAYLSLTANMIAFLITAVLGLFITPTVLGVAAWRREVLT